MVSIDRAEFQPLLGPTGAVPSATLSFVPFRLSLSLFLSLSRPLSLRSLSFFRALSLYLSLFLSLFRIHVRVSRTTSVPHLNRRIKGDKHDRVKSCNLVCKNGDLSKRSLTIRSSTYPNFSSLKEFLCGLLTCSAPFSSAFCPIICVLTPLLDKRKGMYIGLHHPDA